MKQKTMYYILLAIGLLLVAVGLWGLLHTPNNKKAVAAATEAPVPVAQEAEVDETETTVVKTSENPAGDNLTEAEQKGQAFEDYVIGRFGSGKYTLVEKVNDYTTRHHTTERSRYPDLVLRHNESGREFAVECKYRSSWSVGKQGEQIISWVKQQKIDDYNRFAQERDMDVIVLFGVGGEASRPAEVYALPLRLLQKPMPQRKAFLKGYALNTNASFEYSERQHTITTVGK